jgi:2-aminobenzoate-CoA ligase
VPDATRGQIVRAFAVVNPGFTADDELVAQLQDFVKNIVAPYQYPRVITFVRALPRIETGKLKRFELRAAT